MPTLAAFVERREMSAIVRAIESGKNFVIVDGGNRAGKSVAVKVAASRLSLTRTVRWSVCGRADTAATVLWRLFGLDDVAASSLSRIVAGVARLSPPAPPSVDVVKGLLLSANSGLPEPVLVVEMAERLHVDELKALLDVAKELVDERRGRFILVFSPTDKFDAIGDFGSVSRAKVVHVGDLSDVEATQYLERVGCSAGRAAALYALVGGHLPHLVSDSVAEYCAEAASLAEVEGEVAAEIDAQVTALDRVRGGKPACRALCGVLAQEWPEPDVLSLLLRKHLVVAALKGGVHVESRAVRAYAASRCSCGGLLAASSLP